MKNIESNTRLPLICCINSVRGIWAYRLLTSESTEEDIDRKHYIEWRIKGNPSISVIKQTILDWYNAEIDQKILSGFTWKGYSVWLSSENQFNYKASHDLAVMTNGESLKTGEVVFKFGTDEEPIYYTFTELEDIQDFYVKSVQHISKTLKEGWEAKGSINWEEYKV